VSTATWNLKAKRGSDEQKSHEADAPGEMAHIIKAQYLYRRCGRRCDGHTREGVCALPGEIWLFAERRLCSPRDEQMSDQKSAEAIVTQNIDLARRAKS